MFLILEIIKHVVSIMSKLLKRFLSNEDGNIGLMGVIGGATVLSASALAIEYNMLFGSQTSLQ